MKIQKLLVPLLGISTLVAGLAMGLVHPGQAYATQITTRSLTLQDGATDGGSKPGGTVKHLFTVTLPSTTTIHSIKFQYCTSADGTCTEPTGLVTAGASLGSQTGLTFDSVVATTEGSPYLTSAAGVTPSGSTAASFQLLSIVNPTTPNVTFYVRISTYTSTDATTGPVDSGNVAASTATAVQLNGIMPESLVFCTGGTVGKTNGVPDCTTATSGSVNFNADFSPTATAFTTSQMAASTNAGFGYAITVGGTTMTSGGNTITAIGGTAGNSVLGVDQFGLNLKLNDGSAYAGAPNVTNSANIAPVSDGINFFGAPTTNFGGNGTFAFDPASLNTVAKSDNGTGTAGPSDVQIYTASYIVNVRGNQPAGTYTTTLTYICTPTF